MSGETVKTKSIFIPPPIGGLNLRDPISSMDITDAVRLENFYCLTRGIRNHGLITLEPSFTTEIDTLIGLNDVLIIGTDNKIYTKASVSGSPTNQTGVLAITNNKWQHVVFKQRAFLANGQDQMITVAANGVASASAFEGPGNVDTSFIQVWSFKQRIYAIPKATTTYWYAEPEAVTGGMTPVDVGAFLQQAGNLVFGESWTFLQGNQTEELLVLMNEQGEILIYSGDYPDAPNWQLVAHLKLPIPAGNRCHYKIGSELYIQTIQGVFPLSQAFQYIGTSATFYAASDKLGQAIFQTSTDLDIAEHGTFPILFFGVDDLLLLLNYQTGSWSQFNFLTNITAVTFWHGVLWIANAQGSPATGALFYINDDQPDFSSEGGYALWQSSFQNLGTNNQKVANIFRLITNTVVSVPEDGGTTTIACQGIPDFEMFDGQGFALLFEGDIQEITQVTGQNDITEFTVPVQGRYLSFSVDVSNNYTLNQVLGIHLFFQEGGAY